MTNDQKTLLAAMFEDCVDAAVSIPLGQFAVRLADINERAVKL